MNGGPLIALDARESRAILDDGSEELVVVSGRIVGAYAEVLARFVARAFAGQPSGDAAAVRTAIDAIRRLAVATGASDQIRLLAEWDPLADALAGPPAQRRRALARLQAWIPAFAATLPAPQADRLAAVLRWDPKSQPLLDELGAIKGIGPQRLQRLYAAGLFTIDAVARAEASEIAAVTGIPRALAAQVIAESGRYAQREHDRCIEALTRYVARFQRVAGAVEAPDRRAIAELLRVLEDLLDR